MGSIITLQLGAHLIDSAKNGTGQLHGVLFQTSDIGLAGYDYVDCNNNPVTEMRESAVRPLSAISRRLDLLGFTLKTSTALITQALTTISAAEWPDLPPGEFVRSFA